MSETKSNILDITEHEDGQRLDNFLIKTLKGVPKSHIYRIVRHGEVRVNKKRIKPDYRLQVGDIVRLPPMLRTTEKETATPHVKLVTLLQERIIYEDASLLIINKPSGIASHGGSGINFGVIEALRTVYSKLELVHRLDRGTSGCMILAKKRSALLELHALIRENKIKKSYQALVRGRWQGGKRMVDAPLLKNQLCSGERIVIVNKEHGKAACTEFRPLQRLDNATLVEARLHSGRTHQIRVHAAYIGHHIAGDEKYGDTEFNKIMRKKGLRRLFLHAYALQFNKINIVAELDSELLAILKEMSR
ncbi:MAG: RluA family pseudouridine synthase [Gammaproteobacteria bacterium]|nr:RluA family pseudouridine synthase [Gammaproteobacteria bacterium]